MQPITTEHIEFFKPPKAGFFQYKEQLQKCPCLVVGQVKLPIAPSSNLFLLVYDRGGEYHWLPGNKVSFESSETRAINSSSSTQKASWFRFLYNGYEPDNIVQLTGELTHDGTKYVVFQMSGRLVFNDGCFFVSIYRTEDHIFCWRKDDTTGIADSFIDAWEQMPAYVTNPDDYEESPIFCHDLPLRASVSDVGVIASQSEF
jgi:hypothetical protein